MGPQHIIFTDHDRPLHPVAAPSIYGRLISTPGGTDSPSAIAAVELGLPTIIGVEGAVNELVDGLSVIINASAGQVSEWRR